MRSPDRGTVHIIGAGLAGLAAAVRLAGSSRQVVLHEATAQAGGRCRCYRDQGTGMLIDNGTHLVLSGNGAALSYVRTDRRRSRLEQAGGGRLSLRRPRRPTRAGPCASATAASRGGCSTRRSACRRPARSIICLSRGWPGRPTGRSATLLDCAGPLYERVLEPFLLAALNIDPREGSAQARRRGDPRNAGARRRGLPAAAGARRHRQRVRRAGAALSAGARRRDRVRRRAACACASRSAPSRNSISPAAPSACRQRRRHPGGAGLRRGGQGARPQERRPRSAASSTRISASIRPAPCRRCSASSTAPANGSSRIPAASR